MPVTNPSLCKTLVHHSLCSLLFSIASLNAGVLLVPLNNHWYWDTTREVALLLHKSSWKFNTHTFYCAILLLSSSSSTETREQMLQPLPCSILFLFNSQCISCNTQHCFKAVAVGAACCVFCRNMSSERLTNSAETREQVCVLPCLMTAAEPSTAQFKSLLRASFCTFSTERST